MRSELTREHIRVIAAQVTGSVGVRHAEIQSADAKLSLGKRARMIAYDPPYVRNDGPEESENLLETTIQPNAIVGTTIMRRPFACFFM